MKKLPTTVVAAAALMAISASCADTESPEPTALVKPTPAATVFSPLSDGKPLPADEVFFPDAYAEDRTLFFRVQMLPGYYLYKDKIVVRSLSDDVGIDGEPMEDKWSAAETIVDEWFGEQAVFFIEASGAVPMRQHAPDVHSFDIELSYQGCKQDDICYLPQTKVLSVRMPAQLESAADKTE